VSFLRLFGATPPALELSFSAKRQINKKRYAIMVNLSVIIPFYNCKNYFAQCLDSVLAQSHLSLEIVLVNDGSNDGSEKIAEEYARQDARIILYNQKNKGIPFARNKGLELASGEYFLFIDADDYIAPNTLHQLYRTARENELDILQMTIYTRKDGQKMKIWRIYPVHRPLSGIAYFELMIRKRSIRNAPYMSMVKNTFWKSSNLIFDERLSRCQDFDFYTKLLLKAGRIMNTSLAYYYFNVDSNTSVKKDRHNICQLFGFYRLIMDNFSTFVRKENLAPKIASQLAWLAGSHVYTYKPSLLKDLPDTDRKYWNAFIRQNIFKNGGWLRPWLYLRYLKTF
jgi:glycosyltransferase involved in cell wall biosynthesis